MILNFFIPGNINTLTGGYIYDKRMVEGLTHNGHVAKVHSLDSDFPFPSHESKLHCKKTIDSIAKGEIIIFDSLVFGAIPDLLKEIKQDYSIVALIHLPLSMNPGFSNIERTILSNLEKEAFEYTDLIIVTSNFIKEKLVEFGIDPSVISVVIPGVEVFLHKKDYSPISSKLLSISNYTRNKGHLHLINSLSELKQCNWQLDCYGNKNFDPNYVKELDELIVDNNLSDRISLHSSLSGYELSKAYVDSDLLIHPSEFESYGMVLTEALAHGIPVLASTGGASNQTVPSSMGIFFNFYDENSLKVNIKQLLTDKNLYNNLCIEASKYAHQAQSWEKSVKEFEIVLQNLV